MNITLYTCLIIIGCGLVTWIPRILPFIFVRKLSLRKPVLTFLSYVPICILMALFVQNLFVHRENQLPQINWEYFFATIPTLITAVLTKNIMWIVLIGIITMAAIRYWG